MKNSTLRYLTECAIMIALSALLSLMTVYQPPFGGSVTFASTLPLCVIAYRYGFVKSLPATFAASVLQLLLGAGNLAYAVDLQGFFAILMFDYLVAFSLYSVVGLFRTKSQSRLVNSVFFTIGTVAASVVRFLCHFFTGVVIWYSLTREWYADQPEHFVFKYGPYMYSFLYNLSYLLPDTIITILAGFFLCLIIDIRNNNLQYRRISPA